MQLNITSLKQNLNLFQEISPIPLFPKYIDFPAILPRNKTKDNDLYLEE
jgi:hypothetical protein